MPRASKRDPQAQERQRRHVFAVLDALWRDRASLDLNTIDGEFYFRCCYEQFDRRIDAVRTLDSSDGSSLHTSLLALWQDFQLPKRVGWDHIVNGSRLRLRDPELTTIVGAEVPGEHDDPTQVEQAVSLKVYSPAWTGADVAQYIAERYEPRYPVRTEDDTSQSVSLNVQLMEASPEAAVTRELQGYGLKGHELAFRQALSEEDDGFIEYSEPWRTAGAPYIAVTVGLPLPPAPVVAAMYDSLVRDHFAWHTVIAQATEQTETVAIRTWVIALLLKHGLTTEQAIGQWQRWLQRVENATDFEPLSDKQFKANRRCLLARVPEAERHLIVRRKPLARLS